MTVLGIDKGTVYTKSMKVRMRSLIREVADEMDAPGLNRNGKRVCINGQSYIIGEKGEFATDLNKSTHDSTKNLIYAVTAMSLDAPQSDVNLVVGLPVAQYTRQREAMKDLLLSPADNIEVQIGRDRKLFKISRVEVFPEGAGAYYAQDTTRYVDRRVLVVDIGGLSVDNVLFANGNMDTFSTYEMGMMTLFHKLAAEVNRTMNTRLTAWDIDEVLAKGLRIEGETQNISFLNGIIENHVEEIYRNLKLEYDLRSVDEVILAGGGGAILHPHFKSHIKQLQLADDPQMANVRGFQYIAEAIYGADS